MPRTLSAALAALVALVILPGCGLIGGASLTPEQVAGTYRVVEFRFVPNASAIATADVLDELDSDDTYLELLTGGVGQFNLRAEGERASLQPGTFGIGGNNVTFRFTGGDRDTREALLLPNRVTFSASGSGTLIAEEEATVDLEAFDGRRYAGLENVEGVLRMRLVRSDGRR